MMLREPGLMEHLPDQIYDRWIVHLSWTGPELGLPRPVSMQLARTMHVGFRFQADDRCDQERVSR
jgi:hypothetical protein